MLSTMQDFPLSVNMIFRHGAGVFGNSEIATFDGEAVHRTSFRNVAARSRRLSAALRRLGITPGDRVGSFCWNTQEHFEAYLAVPCMGSVLHTLNVRLFPEQLAYTVNHAENRVIIVHDSLAPVLAKAAHEFKTVERYIVIGNAEVDLPGETLRYEDLLSGENEDADWPDPDERSAAAICYTSGTTGNPKGVVYSHRSIYLHAAGICSANGVGLGQNDKVLVVASMFHACAWGLPFATWMCGANVILPGRFLQADPLSRLIAEERPTVASGVPTIWSDVSRIAEANGRDLSSIRYIICGGSAVPRSLIERLEEKHGARLVQAWGMTETSPFCATAEPPKGCPPERAMNYRSKTGRAWVGVEFRIVEDGVVQPRDGQSVGEIQVRGPWITASYLGNEGDDKFEDGWLKTGDVGTLDEEGFIQITDRAKDVLKSGGEWVSSVELENAIMAHADVIEAAVIGVPDDRWDERPLACVVLKQGSEVTAQDLRTFLEDKVARWWIPERWSFIEEVPKTSVGKFDKKVLRARNLAGELRVEAAQSKLHP